MKRNPLITTALAAGLLAGPVGCTATSDDSQSCVGGKCDDLDETPFEPTCGSLVDNSGRGQLPSFLKRDPLIAAVFNPEDPADCPDNANIVTLIEKLKEVDGECENTQPFSADDDGLATRIISEFSALQDEAVRMRAVTSKGCDREQHSIVFSTFGFQESGGNTPSGVEIMTFTPSEEESPTGETSGIFNYYKAAGFQDSTLRFFGSSVDFVTKGAQGPDPFNDPMGCAHCHNGGGLVMKEMRSPWLHWDPNQVFQETVDNHEWMGGKTGGANLEERTVEPGNLAWNNTRVEVMVNEVNRLNLAQQSGNSVEHPNSLKELLTPLFCPTEVNLATSTPSSSVPSNMILGNAIHGNNFSFAAPHDNLGSLASTRSISHQGESSEYEAIREAIGQRVPGIAGGANDTEFENPYLERAMSDVDYVDELINRKIIDQQFARDVLMVDFTRPVFSTDRCELVNHLEGETVELALDDETNVDRIRALLIDKLSQVASAGEGSPEGLLLDHLEASAAGESFDHQATVEGFVAACEGRTDTVQAGDTEVNGFLADAIKFKSLQLKIADGEATPSGSSVRHHGPTGALLIGAQEVFEGGSRAAKYTADDISVSEAADPGALLSVHPDARLSPASCELVSEFVRGGPEVEPGPDPEPDPEPAGNPCAHSPCEEGEKLDPACDDERVGPVCEADEFCCETEWDNLCVDATPDCN